jgi:hypothetical protein
MYAGHDIAIRNDVVQSVKPNIESVVGPRLPNAPPKAKASRIAQKNLIRAKT